MAQSFVVHALALYALWAGSRAWALRPRIAISPAFSKADVLYYARTEYLQPLDTGATRAPGMKHGDPVLNRQAILSVPPESNNRTQTVVTPPDVKLDKQVVVPNVVAWKTVNPAVPISATSRVKVLSQPPAAAVVPPAPVVEQAAERRQIQAPADAVISPVPDFTAVQNQRTTLPQVAIVQPPPEVRDQIRQLGDLNIGHSNVVPPAPQLPAREPHSVAALRQSQAGILDSGIVPPPPPMAATASTRVRGGVRRTTEVVPPPPAVRGSGPDARIVALGLHPDASAPPIAAGNRRGTFALSPEGKMGGSGSPGSKTAAHDGGPGNGNRPGSSDLPSGLEVRPVDPITNPSRDHQDRAANVIADAKPPLWPSSARAAKTIMTEPTAEEREVFGARKFYSMTLNMPNLNSAGGSWVIRFAELNDNAEKGELIAPEATRKVDPAYPLELMRSQVQGKVTLYALIRRDGTVAGVRVLNSVDDRLDEYARAALSNWHFHPATRSGNPVDLEAVVTIPFRTRAGF